VQVTEIVHVQSLKTFFNRIPADPR